MRKMKNIHIHLEEELYDKIKKIFPHHGGISLVIRKAIIEYIENREKAERGEK